MSVPHRKHKYGLPRSVTGKALLFYMLMMIASQETHLWPPRPVTEIALLLYMYVRTSRETPGASTACYGDSFTFSDLDYVRISQETDLDDTIVCSWDSVTFGYR
jgi:hypothetical protein